MLKELNLRVFPEVAASPKLLLKEVEKVLKRKNTCKSREILGIHTLRRSIDARSKLPVMQLQVQIIYKGEETEWEAVQRALNEPKTVYLPDYPDVRKSNEVHIVGAGPAGLFAALKVIEYGLKPVIWERGKDVRERVKDLKDINVHHKVNPDSNYCFGEGGAGTYSDGKLYTRAKKRGDVKRILELLVGFGAIPEILVETHPHIGTNKLPKIIATIRKCILEHGGEVHFGNRVVDMVLEDFGDHKRIIGLEVMQLGSSYFKILQNPYQTCNLSYRAFSSRYF